MENKFQEALDVATRYGFEASEKLRAEVADLENPKYRIAVVGPFQVGKTRLLNTVFLSDDPVLAEGNGECTTAVTTELQYGEQRRLEIYRWKDDEHQEEVLDKVIDNPTKAELMSFTVSPEKRGEQAKRIPRVKLFSPNDALKEYTFLDTPGINDSDPEILFNTTYRLLPSADLAILVIPARGLGEQEKELLTAKLLQEGICRLMVLISYRTGDGLSSEDREKLQAEIREQLIACGLKDCPVKMYCYNNAVSDILCSPDEIALSIQNFLSENAMAGRLQHVGEHVRNFLQNCLLNLTTKLRMIDQSAAENQQQLQRFDQRRQETQAQFEALCQDLDKEFRHIQERSDNRVGILVKEIFDEFIDSVEAEEDLARNQNQIKHIENFLRPKMRTAVEDCALNLDRDLKESLSDFNGRFEKIGRIRNNYLMQELPNVGGVLGKIHPFLTTLVDIAILNLILPMGWITAIIGKAIQDRIPLVKKIASGQLVRVALINKTKNTLDEIQPKIVGDVQKSLNTQLEKIRKQLQEVLQKQFDANFNVVMLTMNDSAGGDRDTLVAAKDAIEAALREI